MAATSVVSREDIGTWPADSPKLWLFRRGLEGLQEISDQALMDERGYQWLAGVHGGFGGDPYCQHNNDHFLTWHRPYLLDFELKLRARIADVAGQAEADEWRLPYWAWDDPEVQGLPEAFTVETYDDQGEIKPNPLRSMPYRLQWPPIFGPGDPVIPADATWRAPGDLVELQKLGPMVRDALTLSDYHEFRVSIERPHNQIHNWTDGFMASFRSAFDPIFWCHHANVDRQLWMWQQGAGDATSIPKDVRQFPCQPFSFIDIRAEAFLDTRELGYTYNLERRLVRRDRFLVASDPNAPMRLDFGPPPSRYSMARINLHGVAHPETTCELRFAAGGSELGAYTILGRGPCPGAPGHCDPDAVTGQALRPPHHLAPFDLFIDVTRALEARAANSSEPLVAELVIVDHRGETLPADAVPFDNATMTFR